MNKVYHSTGQARQPSDGAQNFPTHTRPPQGPCNRPPLLSAIPLGGPCAAPFNKERWGRTDSKKGTGSDRAGGKNTPTIRHMLQSLGRQLAIPPAAGDPKERTGQKRGEEGG